MYILKSLVHVCPSVKSVQYIQYIPFMKHVVDMFIQRICGHSNSFKNVCMGSCLANLSRHYMNIYQIYALSPVLSCKCQVVTEAFWETGCYSPSGEVHIQEHIYIQMHLHTITHTHTYVHYV